MKKDNKDNAEVELYNLSYNSQFQKQLVKAISEMPLAKELHFDSKFIGEEIVKILMDYFNY